MKVISIGMFTPGNTAVVWRGPMLHRALQQFLADVYWGDLDVLLMDLPPGTGDIAISVAQLVPVGGAAGRHHPAAGRRARWPSGPGRSRCRPTSRSSAWSRTCRGWSCRTAAGWSCSAAGGGAGGGRVADRADRHQGAAARPGADRPAASARAATQGMPIVLAAGLAGRGRARRDRRHPRRPAAQPGRPPARPLPPPPADPRAPALRPVGGRGGQPSPRPPPLFVTPPPPCHRRRCHRRAWWCRRRCRGSAAPVGTGAFC